VLLIQYLNLEHSIQFFIHRVTLYVQVYFFKQHVNDFVINQSGADFEVKIGGEMWFDFSKEKKIGVNTIVLEMVGNLLCELEEKELLDSGIELFL
jgi:uncharacterized linocin/CFP29 family protein